MALGGKIVPFAGFEMPVQYPTGITAEHNAVRQSCGLFDVSHMGEFIITGPQAVDFVNSVTTNNVAALEMARCITPASSMIAGRSRTTASSIARRIM